MRLGKLVAVAALSVVSASTVAAQSNKLELTVGLAALSVVSSDGGGDFTILNVNQESVRLGFPLSPTVMLEPTFSLSMLTEDGDTFTNIGLGAFVPFHFGASSAKGVYIAPGAFMNYSSVDDDTFGGASSSQMSIAVELGKKALVSDAVAIRFGGQLQLGLENDDYASYTALRAFFGLTVKLK